MVNPFLVLACLISSVLGIHQILKKENCEELIAADENSYEPELNGDVKHDYLEKRKQMISLDKSTHFTVDVKALTPEEKEFEQRLFGIRDSIITGDSSPLLMEVHDAIDSLKTSHLFTVLRSMPKGAHLHFHIEGGLEKQEFLEFTKQDIVYYSEKDDMLITAPKGLDAPGYKSCNELRASWKEDQSFDEYLKGKFILNKEETKSKRSRKIWESFEHKFDFINGLVHYHKFYKQALVETAKKAMKDGVKILEIRHAFGRVFNDNCGTKIIDKADGKEKIVGIDAPFETLTIEEELELYNQAIKEIKEIDPDFELLLITVGFKALGHEHVTEQIESHKYALENGFDFVTAFDIVNEEDKVKPILYFIDELLEAKSSIPKLEFIFHAGESISRYNENEYDAILLGTKRIGHSVPLILHPHLMQLSRSNQIGIEVCPISHWILGYIYDPRWHPARQMMASQLGVTVSSDLHTFYDYDTLTVDYVLAFLAWQLDLKDLKQLWINSIKYSSIQEDKKEKYLDHFKNEWDKFIADSVKLK